MNCPSPSGLSHARLRCIIFLFTLVGALCLETCKDNPVSQGSGGIAGVAGTVYDTSGHPLDSVRVYSLYSFNIGYNMMSHRMHVDRINNVDTFGFNLYQNLPNPIQNSAYLRFSIPVPSSVSISLTDRMNGVVVYSLAESFLDGMYQLYLDNLVDSLQMHNGPYLYKFRAIGNGGQKYSGSKEVFVVSDVGRPNSVT